MTVRALWFLLLALGLAPLWGQVRLSNPGFADRETLSYLETLGSAPGRPFEASLTLVGSGPSARLEYRTKGTDLESLYRIDPVALVSLSSETLTRAPDATVRRTADYQDLKPAPGSQDLVITDMGSLPVVLRGFPWGQISSAKILYVGNVNYGGTGVAFELQVVGRDKVDAVGRSWDCWHVTTGLGGALSLVMSKTDWWFAVEGTHPLVKTSGPASGPGSALRTLVLRSYSTGKP
jgi:hypothetical protein